MRLLVLRRFRADRRAVAAVELALIAPVLIILFMASIEVTQLIRVQLKLDLAAQAMQDMITGPGAGTGTTPTSVLENAELGGQLMMTPFTASSLAVAITGVTFSSSGVPSGVAWQVLENGAPGVAVATACALAGSLSLGGDTVVIVYATMSYVPIFSAVLKDARYTLTATAYGRPRSNAAMTVTSTVGAATGTC